MTMLLTFSIFGGDIFCLENILFDRATFLRQTSRVKKVFLLILGQFRSERLLPVIRTDMVAENRKN